MKIHIVFNKHHDVVNVYESYDECKHVCMWLNDDHDIDEYTYETHDVLPPK